MTGLDERQCAHAGRLAGYTTMVDAMPGLMTAFEIITVRITDAGGIEGVGHTYANGHNGGAVHTVLARETADRSRQGRCPDRATGETLRTLWEFKQMIACGGMTFPEPDVTHCGGVTPGIKIARLAEAYNLPVTSACPNGAHLKVHGFGLDRYLAGPLRIVDGMAVAADRPGHGMAFEWKALEGQRA